MGGRAFLRFKNKFNFTSVNHTCLKQVLFFLMLFVLNGWATAQKVSGRAVVDDSVPLPMVLAVNISTGEKANSDSEGNFTISAKPGDEIRFVKAGYERSAVKVSSENSFIYVNMVRAAHEIEEVNVNKVRLSGDINKDAGLLSKSDKTEQLQKDIGLPKLPEKPREKPAEIVNDVLLPILTGRLNVQAIYDIASGDARRKKSLYKFEDLQSDVKWIRQRLDNDYFTEAGVPEIRISEFIEFSFARNPKIRTYVQAKNLSGAMIELEPMFQIYLKRLEQ